MKKFIVSVFFILLSFQSVNAAGVNSFCIAGDECAVKKVLNSQVHYANRYNFKKFISTYDTNYTNSDGFDYDTYSKLVKEIWDAYKKIKYGIEINKITINENDAVVELTESSVAELPSTKDMPGELKSTSNSIYYLKKINGKWKVTYDSVIDENTSMLYGTAQDIDIKLTVPNTIKANTEYCASLELTPPEGTLAIASIAADKVQYPQKQPEEIFRAMPEDNILERLFTSNNENMNEYVVASVGLTKSEITDLSIKLSLTGYGYAIKRVNVVSKEKTLIQDVEHEAFK